MLVYAEENYPLSGLHVDSTKKEQAAQLSGLLTKEGLQRMTKN